LEQQAFLEEARNAEHQTLKAYEDKALRKHVLGEKA
jgi:hypothetical protein